MYPYNIDQPHYSQSASSISARKHPSTSSDKTTQPVDQKLLSLIEEAIADEIRDSNMFKSLMDRQKTKIDKEIMRGIYLDELKHRKYFEEIYESLTGHKPQTPEPAQMKMDENMSQALEKALFGEWGAIEFYRQILFSILDLEIRDMLYEIITDEQKHTSQLQYLSAKKNPR